MMTTPCAPINGQADAAVHAIRKSTAVAAYAKVPLSAASLRKLEQIKRLADSINGLSSLYPCAEVNGLFESLVSACVDADAEEEEVALQLDSLVRYFSRRVGEDANGHWLRSLVYQMEPGGGPHFLLPSAQDRQSLIVKCAEAETLMERDFAQRLGALKAENDILAALQTFRFIRNYEKLTRLEYHLLLGQEQCTPASLRNVAFVGSGPLPLTTLFLVDGLLPQHTVVTNYDIDRESNGIARRWMHALPALRERVVFQTADILDVPPEELRRYDVVVLAALVGVASKMKCRILHHLRRGMKDGSFLLLRSAQGAKAFLYPVVDLVDLREWRVCSVTHPKGEVVNSVIVVTKKSLDVADVDLWG